MNAVVVPTNLSPQYAPAGQSLVSVSTVGVPREHDELLELRVREQLRRWFGGQVDAWRLLRTYRIPHGLPAFIPPTIPPADRPPRLASGLYLCGDHVSAPSLNEAMGSGRRAAEAVLAGV